MASETSKFRGLLHIFCKGNGIDLGSGGDPIHSQALSIDFVSEHYQPVGVQFNWFFDARFIPIKDNFLDFVYSSHLLEDFENTIEVLREWIRVLRSGGSLVLLLPDERKYKAHCEKTGQTYNILHKHENFGVQYVSDCIIQVGARIIHVFDDLDEYNFAIVARK